MAEEKVKVQVDPAKPTAMSYAQAWGESPGPPAVLATLIAAQHLQPAQYLPLLFPPVLLLSTYLNLNGYKTDAAGIGAAWSGLYLVLASRRKQPLRRKWGVRGVVRGATIGMCVANLLGGGFVYAIGKRRNDASAEETSAGS